MAVFKFFWQFCHSVIRHYVPSLLFYVAWDHQSAPSLSWLIYDILCLPTSHIQ